MDTFYRSRYYKKNEESFNQSLIHKKSISSAKRRKDYSEEIKSKIHLKPDEKIVKDMEKKK